MPSSLAQELFLHHTRETPRCEGTGAQEPEPESTPRPPTNPHPPQPWDGALSLRMNGATPGLLTAALL